MNAQQAEMDRLSGELLRVAVLVEARQARLEAARRERDGWKEIAVRSQTVLDRVRVLCDETDANAGAFGIVTTSRVRAALDGPDE